MHGQEEGGETRKRSCCRHMWSVPSETTTVAVVDSNNSSPNFFFKDGRKISVGDCALFKPQQDSPPFIGIIRCLTSDKESNLKLGVNWLYRPAEVELRKGVALEAAPNEVFYSFHRDEILAASLLHPCKVAFLPKGVELPPGVSSFVCRRVYDITYNCLWWLTDQDYIDDRQEEVDQLLHKTHIEMHATAGQQQQGARSPRPVNGSAASSPLKHSPDSVQNSSSNLSSQAKSKKRERADQSSDPNKRERTVRADDGDSCHLRTESMLKQEIAKITEKGGLVDSEAVERLVQLMQPDKSERKIDLTERSMLAGIIAATDRLDCLSQFVQLKGLPVLDEWLQEVHRGKIGDSGKFRDGGKSVEDFLLVLLRALDKIPVNLNALQMCNIGKSVNHLRSHKNSEIQKKARSLVDTWKKRVEAEMNINDAKSGSGHAIQWPGRSRHDGSHGGNRQPGGSSEAAVRSTVTHHSSLKSAASKLVQGDSASKSASAYTGSVRSALSPTSNTANYKDGQSRVSANGGNSDTPRVAVKEEKSSSSSPSYTNSQCSSDHARTLVPCGKEDARSSTAGSRSLAKMTSSGSKHRKSANGPLGTATSSIQRETVPNRSSSMTMTRISAAERVSHTINAVDASVHEGNNHKLIVKIPNRGRCPAQSFTGGSVEDSSCRNSRASSPALSEKYDQSDACLRGKHDSHHSTEVDGSSTAVHHRTNNDTRRLSNISKVAYSPSRNELKSRKAHDPSFSSMNALVESCVKFSEANASMSAGDDVGMNLLASVAAREISKSGIVSPAVSPQRNSVAAENSSSDYNGNKKQLHGDGVIQQQCQSTEGADADKHNIVAGVSNVNDGETGKHSGASSEGSPLKEEGCLKGDGKSDEKVDAASVPVSSACTAAPSAGDGAPEVINEKSNADKDESHDQLPDRSQGHGSVLTAEDKLGSASLNEDSGKGAHSDAVLNHSSDVDDGKYNVVQVMQNNAPSEQNSIAVVSKSESMNTNEKAATVPSGAHQDLAAEHSNEAKSEKSNGMDLSDHTDKEANREVDEENDPCLKCQKQEDCGISSANMDQSTSCKDENIENKNSIVLRSGSSATQVSASAVAPQECETQLSTKESELAVVKDERKEESASAMRDASPSPPVGASDVDAKLGFDLNEGLDVDDGQNGEPMNSGAGPCPATFCSVNPSQIPVSSASSALPASVTVASAAKGPFVPPDDLLKNKRELGWKGSAATSAFRPAEPRKITEVPIDAINASLPDTPPCKKARPFLDFDLNVADERILLDVDCQPSGQGPTTKNNPTQELMATAAGASLRCSGGLDLDLNKADEAPDIGHQSATNGPRFEVSTSLRAKPSLLSNNLSNGEASRRDFDLNNGPVAEEMPVEQSSYNQHARSTISLQTSFGPTRINSSDAGNGFSWFPSGTSYSVSVTPSALPDREAFPIVGIGGGPQRVMSGPTSSFSFNPDSYRGSVLSSSPTMPFHSTPFQYPVFPFGTSFPLPTSALSVGSSAYVDPTSGGRISAIPSQLVGTAAAVPFQYPHAFVVSRPISDITSSCVIDSNQKWGKQGLDLNSGPGGLDVEGREESLSTTSRQLLPAISSQSLAEEQVRMYNMAGGGVLKRKEPEGGWNMDKLNFKQSSWR